MSDIFYGTVTLPDGRLCKAVVRGRNYPNTWSEPGYFELNDDDPLEIENINGAEPDADEYDREYEIGGKTVTLSDYVIDWLIDHGKFEAWEPDYD